jgi:ABC-type branched-subunit amino acid transport system ATPase component
VSPPTPHPAALDVPPLLRATLHLGDAGRSSDAPPATALTCEAGEVVELVGEAAVTALVGERRTRGDRIELGGRRVDRRTPAGRVRAGLAVVRGTEVAADVSVRDHLVAAAGRRRAADLLAEAPWLADRGDAPAGVLSGGERRLLGWSLARAADPRVVLLDRAGTGLDAAALAWAHRLVDGWVDRGAGVLVVVGRPEEGRWVSHRADGRPRAPHGPG